MSTVLSRVKMRIHLGKGMLYLNSAEEGGKRITEENSFTLCEH